MQGEEWRIGEVKGERAEGCRDEGREGDGYRGGGVKSEACRRMVEV